MTVVEYDRASADRDGARLRPHRPRYSEFSPRETHYYRRRRRGPDGPSISQLDPFGKYSSGSVVLNNS